jgi:nucleotide-binding universal stress UspA family protein
MLRTILAAYDGSEHAQKALRLAGDLAARYDALVVVAHVVTDAPLPEELVRMIEVEHLVEPAEEGRSGPGTFLRPAGLAGEPEGRRGALEARMAIGRRLAEHGQELAREAGAPRTEHVLESGDPAEAVLRAAEHTGADLIVLGSRGLGPLRGLWLGSVSHKIAQLAPTPVLTVR